MENVYGLVGLKLGHSFSQKYFTEKFNADAIGNSKYMLFELGSIEEFPQLLKENPNLKGLNVTIPYKEEIIRFLDGLDPVAARIGAVNVVTFKDGKRIGYNSDYVGFKRSLEKFYPVTSSATALVLGTGGASKAVIAALEDLQIAVHLVSRQKRAGHLTYQDLTPAVMASVSLIINASPVGTFPQTDAAPDIPYQLLTPRHYLYDLVYNPTETLFMKKGKLAGATTINGYEMLCLQAEAAWKIWNS